LKKKRFNIDENIKIVSINLCGLKDVGTQYSIIEKELMAITLTLKNISHIILGNSYFLLVVTDHKNLTVWKKFGVCRYRHFTWIEALMEFKIQAKFSEGYKNNIADRL
jgi:RNase H-like domain found in reverse transcriptase